MDSEHFIHRALALAKKGQGRTSPNPMVGAVLVHNGKIIAEGYHHKIGGDHAEIDCLKKINFAPPKNATLYVTLEPCSHYGRTPPCADALIKCGLRRVVVAMVDPNPKVSGRGIARLKKAGIAVTVGVLEKKARALNRDYIHFFETGRPYVILKSAISLDGMVGLQNGESKWVTGLPARTLGHQLRREVDAILVGIGTVLNDDPELTIRHVPSRGRSPLKVILDPSLKISPKAKALQTGESLILCRAKALKSKKATDLTSSHIKIEKLPTDKKGQFKVAAILDRLAQKRCLSVLIEGGPKTYSAFLQENLVDEMALFIAPKLLGSTGLPWLPHFQVRHLKEAALFSIVAKRQVGEDLLLSLVKK